MQIKVLHILNTNSYSGAENVALTIMKNMGSGFVSAYASYDGSIREILRQNNIEFYPFDQKASIKSIKRLVNAYKPDLIHAHDYTISVLCSAALINIPIISHLHNNSPWIKKLNANSLAYFMSSLRIKKILTVSNSIRDEYIFGKMLRHKTLVVGNPVDIKSVRQMAENPEGAKETYDVVFVGRLTESKDPFRFIRLISEVGKKKPSIRVAIIGTGNLENECRELHQTLCPSVKIEFKGFISNPFPLIKSSKVLCITSKWEGFGLVAIEAMSFGVPVIATPAGGLQELINANVGLLTNSDSKYVDEIIRIIEDAEYRAIKSNNCLEYIKRYETLNEYISKIEAVYHEVLSQNN